MRVAAVTSGKSRQTRSIGFSFLEHSFIDGHASVPLHPLAIICERDSFQTSGGAESMNGLAGDSGVPEQIQCALSDTFGAWLSQMGGSLAVTTYQAGKVALIGWDG